MALFAWFKTLALDQFFSSSTLVIFFDLSFSFKCAFLMNIVTMSQKLMSWVWNPANCGTWAWISDCWLTSNSLYSSKIATFFVITFLCASRQLHGASYPFWWFQNPISEEFRPAKERMTARLISSFGLLLLLLTSAPQANAGPIALNRSCKFGHQTTPTVNILLPKQALNFNIYVDKK